MEVTWDQEEAQAHNLLGSGPSPLVLLRQGVTGGFALPKPGIKVKLTLGVWGEMMRGSHGSRLGSWESMRWVVGIGQPSYELSPAPGW